MIASTSRFYAMDEKIAMGDGRYDQERLIKSVEGQAQAHLLVDMEALAKQTGAMINAVMLGALAGCGRLPIPAEAFEAAIRADGKAVDSNLRGFRAGLGRAGAAMRRRPGRPTSAAGPATSRRHARAARSARHAGAARDIMVEGVRRLAPTRTSPMRGSISTGSSRSATPTSARAPAASCCRDRAASRGAHVVRGRDPRRRRPRSIRRAWRASPTR